MDRLTRRRFLENSLLAVGAASMGASSLAEDRPKRGRTVGPNDRIRVAVIGIGGPPLARGMDHVKAWLGMDDVDLVYVCDADTASFERAMKAAESAKKSAPKPVQDMRRILEDKSVDAVSIATGNYWHALAAIWAIQAGKDVYVEKPVSHNVWEGRKIVEAARKYSRICQTGTQSRASTGLQEGMKYLHEGKLGKVHLARALCYKRRVSIGKADGPQAPPPTVDYDLWCGPAQKLPIMRQRFHYDWHWQWNTGNGDLGNQGIHEMDKARWGLNKHGFPKTAFALGGRFGYVDDGETPNTELVFLDYGDSQIIFEVRGLETSDYKGVKIGNMWYGEKGYMVAGGDTACTAFDNDGNKVAEFKGGGDHFRNFIDVMRSRRVSDLNADIEEGHLSSALCHLGGISYRLGTPESFSSKQKRFGDNREAYETVGRFEDHLAASGISLTSGEYTVGRQLSIAGRKESFEGDSEANRLLTREYRKGFEVPSKV